MADQRQQCEQEEVSAVLDIIITLSELQVHFGPPLEDEIRALSLEDKNTILPKIGLAFARIQSLYRFTEDCIAADTRNREDDLRPTALRNVMNEMPFLYPRCLQINMNSSTLNESQAGESLVGGDEGEVFSTA